MGGELLSRATIDEALGPQAHLRPTTESDEKAAAASRRIAWGLGWGIQLPPEGSGGGPIYWHWGDNGPAKAFVAFDPAAGDGLVYFANGANGLAIAPSLVAPVVGDMDVTFDWLGYERVDAPGFTERLDGALAESRGSYAEAAAAFRAALVADPDDEVTARRVEWLSDLLDVEQRPVEVPAATLAAYAGVYGPRRLELDAGALYYQRGTGTRYRLVPLSATLFALDGLPTFRLEVALDDHGLPIKLVGHYVEGQTDESPRTVDPPA